jgi:asparagine synthetase B (glutamine-hydrolysing)
MIDIIEIILQRLVKVMFIFASKGNSQKINKNVMFDDFDCFRNKLNAHFPKLLENLITIERNNALIAYSAYPKCTAKTKPESFVCDLNDKKTNKTIILGDYAGSDMCFSSSLNGDNCTSMHSAAQKISNMFAQHKENIFSELEKSFLIVSLPADENSIHIATDPLSSRSIYWMQDDSGVLVSTDLQFIQTMLGRPLRLSERGLSSWLSGYPNPAISLFEEINVLPIGYRLELPMENRAKITQFWDIEPENTVILESQSEYSEYFYNLLNNSVTSACDSQQQVIASQMSGGLDSTSITALANDYLNSAGKNVLPLSHMYSQSKKSDESQLVKDMLLFLDIDQSIQMTVDEGEDRDFLALYPSDLESPGTVLSPRYVKELALVKQAGADVLLTGNGGDEMCWGHSAAYTQRFKQGDWRVVTEVLKACGAVGMSKRQVLCNLFVKPFVPELVLKMLTLNRTRSNEQSVPIWITDKAKSLAIEETRIDNPFNKQKDPVGYNRYNSLKTTSTYNAVRSYEKVAQQFDIDVRHPFFNTQLAEFSFAIPDKQLIQGPFPKWLLRHSMQDHLPESVCWNLKKTTFDQHFGNLVRENASELRQVLSDTRLADMGLVNQSLLLTEFDRVVANPDLPLQVDLLYAILTFTWLKTHYPE